MIRRSLTAIVVGTIALLVAWQPSGAWSTETRIHQAVARALPRGHLAAARHQTANDTAFAEIDNIVRTLSDITSLSEKHPVPYGRMTKRQLRQFLNKRIKKTLKPEEIL